MMGDTEELKVGDWVKIVSLPDEEDPGFSPKMETMIGNEYKVSVVYCRCNLYAIYGYLWERQNLVKVTGREEG